MIKKIWGKALGCITSIAISVGIMSTVPASATAAQGIKLHVKPHSSWSQIHIWGWGDYESASQGENKVTPGDLMQVDPDNAGWYTFTYAKGNIFSFVFSEKRNGSQTKNIENLSSGEVWITIEDKDPATKFFNFSTSNAAPEGWVGNTGTAPNAADETTSSDQPTYSVGDETETDAETVSADETNPTAADGDTSNSETGDSSVIFIALAIIALIGTGVTLTARYKVDT